MVHAVRLQRLLAVLVAVSSGACAFAQNYVFTTLAGDSGYGSNDGPSSTARFFNPGSVAVDSSENIFVADAGNHTIRKITAAGLVITLAGSAGIAGSEDGTGSAARFNGPAGIAVDGSGNVFVTDAGNHTIRKITAAGVVTTFAGTAGSRGTEEGKGSAARFNLPMGVAVDGNGDVFVADAGDNTIRKITATGVVTIFAGAYSAGVGDGTIRFNNPSGVAVDGSGNVFVADTYNGAIRKITPAGVVTTLAGGAGNGGSADGTGSDAQFSFPQGVAVDGSGNVFVADTHSSTVRKITTTGVVTTLAGSPGRFYNTDGTGSAARFNGPSGMAVDSSGNLLVADTYNNTIRRITAAGAVTTLAGAVVVRSSVDGTGSAARFFYPQGVAADGGGNLFVVDGVDNTIRKITVTGVVTTLAGTAGSRGSADGVGSAAQFLSPGGVAVDNSGNVFVADTVNYTIRKITATGVVTTLAGTARSRGSADGTGSVARFYLPAGIAVDSGGNVFVADTGNKTIRKITADGVVTTLAGSADSVGSADGTGSAAHFGFPTGIAVDRGGNVFVADAYLGFSIRKITADGVVTTLAGNSDSVGSADGTGSAAQFNQPAGIAVDGGGNVFVADTGNNTIRRITVGGVVTTLAGLVGITGSADGTGSVARFNSPAGIAVDSSGNLFVADSSNFTIRKGVPAGEPVVIATQPRSQSVTAGASTTVTVAATSSASLAFQWSKDGTALTEATSATLTLSDVQPANAGLYTVLVNATASDPAIVGVSTTSKVIGTGIELQPANIVHPNGNVFDQILLSGTAETITADPSQVTRTSYIDLNGDIVQVEFGGAGTLSLVLDNPSGPAAPVNYNQPSVAYMKGHAGIVITGADETTNVGVFSVGRFTAFDPTGTFNSALPIGATNDPKNNGSPLFVGHAATTYDGFADLAFIAISSTNGKFGGLRASNGSFYSTKGVTGIYAPGVQFTGPVFVGDISAADAATPMIVIGSSPDTRITGGDLFQANGQPVQVSGLTALKFTAGTDSQGTTLTAKANRAVLQQDGVDVTSQVVVNPGP